MKPGSEESTNPRIAGVQKEFVHLFPVTIYENTAMYMVLSIQWTERAFFLVMPYCNTECMQVFLNQLRSTFPDDIIVLVCDGAAWHKSGTLEVPEGISILHIPPYTPEMNPIEQIWRELRTRGFRNEVFATLEKVVDRLCKTINHLSRYTVMSITQRKWIKDIFN